jgi:hypothetical protein
MIDLTPLEHVGLAIVPTLIGWVFGNPVAGACFGIALFIGREHAQGEQRAIQRFYNNTRSAAPWFCGFEWRAWKDDKGSLLDFACPAVVCIGLAVALVYWF